MSDDTYTCCRCGCMSTPTARVLFASPSECFECFAVRCKSRRFSELNPWHILALADNLPEPARTEYMRECVEVMEYYRKRMAEQ